ncbi:MAG: S8 family serine peptidase [Saprospiraceae bacterium]|nr:S8 family serine peptidase [Saprospiraceae bacterium]
MKIGRVALPVVFLFFINDLILVGQNPLVVPGSYLMQVQTEKDLNAYLTDFQRNNSDIIASLTLVSDAFQVAMFQTTHQQSLTFADLRRLRNQLGVRVIQANHILEDRTPIAPLNILPNDPLLPLQWQYQNTGVDGGVVGADLEALDAWNITTGGITAANDSIVVAIIDGGFAATHLDIANNIWVNHAEIPADGVDNDQNGFIDDFRGWNVLLEKDAVIGNGGAHGTPIAGIIGATGNNDLGVSGVNWQVKMMLVVGNNTEDQILKAYDYVLKSRRLYNETNGSHGAFVVAVNCSWGINYGQASDAPIWCSVFDTLGQAGILSVAATANIPVNVDAVGDLPTSCPSDFLIAVTSLNKQDNKAPNAAWGTEHIDLGAYGQDVYTTAINDGYGNFEGTSYAAPQVSGAIALLYAAPCSELIALSKSNPIAAAKYARGLLMESVQPNMALQNITKSHGRLNLYQLLQYYQDKCSTCEAPFALKTVATEDTFVQVSWLSSLNTAPFELRFRPQGTADWLLYELHDNTHTFNELAPCTSYEFAVRMQCSDSLWSKWSAVFKFTTGGCCTAPAFIPPVVLSETEITLQWNVGPQMDTIALQFRARLDTSWQTLLINESPFTLQDLNPCTDYAFRWKALCADNVSALSEVLYVKTLGCGACMDFEYCIASASNATQEWIESVSIGDWQQTTTGISEQPYQDFTGKNQQITLEITAGMSYPVTITPGFMGSANKEFYRIYIDFDGDGVFQDNERCFDPGFAHDLPATGWVTAPQNLTPGLSRMRIMMKHENEFSLAPEPCETYEMGQVEDYCVQLSATPSSTSGVMSSKSVFYASPQPAATFTTIHQTDQQPQAGTLTLMDPLGRMLQQFNTPQFPCRVDMHLLPVGVYLLKIQTGVAQQTLQIIHQ